MTRSYRCVVTGRGAEGKSVVIRDSQTPVQALGCIDFWKTNRTPASLIDVWQPETQVQLEPPAEGTIFRFFEIPPQDPGLNAAEANDKAAAAFAAAGAGHCRVDTRLNPMMHRTDTIDYVVLLQGRVTLLLDQGEVELAPFDAVVQRGTNHYWINKGAEPALLMGVLLPASGP